MIPSCEMQTPISIERLLGNSAYGASPVFNTAVEVKGKFESGSRRVTNAKGEVVVGSGTCFLPAGTTLGIGDRITINAQYYVVIDVQWESMMGRIDHIEAILTGTSTG